MGEQQAGAPRYVAFLRAINVGGHTVKMDALRAHLAALGFADVQTFIASGNVLFTAPGDPAALEAQIEAHLAATFALHDRELYWRLTTRFSDSPITGARLERALGQPTTLRNITTVRRLAAQAG